MQKFKTIALGTFSFIVASTIAQVICLFVFVAIAALAGAKVKLVLSKAAIAKKEEEERLEAERLEAEKEASRLAQEVAEKEAAEAQARALIEVIYFTIITY